MKPIALLPAICDTTLDDMYREYLVQLRRKAIAKLDSQVSAPEKRLCAAIVTAALDRDAGITTTHIVWGLAGALKSIYDVRIIDAHSWVWENYRDHKGLSRINI